MGTQVKLIIRGKTESNGIFTYTFLIYTSGVPYKGNLDFCIGGIVKGKATIDNQYMIIETSEDFEGYEIEKPILNFDNKNINIQLNKSESTVFTYVWQRNI